HQLRELEKARRHDGRRWPVSEVGFQLLPGCEDRDEVGARRERPASLQCGMGPWVYRDARGQSTEAAATIVHRRRSHSHCREYGRAEIPCTVRASGLIGAAVWGSSWT